MAVHKPAVVHLASPDEIEQQFYDAMQHGDLERLMAIWSDDDDIACVHPGGTRLVGAHAIRASFEQLFSNGPVDVEPHHVHRLSTHSTSVHSVLERLRVMTDEGPQTAWVLATNVYVKTGLGWHLVVHHASPGSASEGNMTGESTSVLH